MIYVLLYLQFSDSSSWRKAFRDHAKWMRHYHRAGKIVTGGPLSDLTGAVGILHVESMAEAHDIAEKEPFVCQGIARMTLSEWNPLIHGSIGNKPLS